MTPQDTDGNIYIWKTPNVFSEIKSTRGSALPNKHPSAYSIRHMVRLWSHNGSQIQNIEPQPRGGREADDTPSQRAKKKILPSIQG